MPPPVADPKKKPGMAPPPGGDRPDMPPPGAKGPGGPGGLPPGMEDDMGGGEVPPTPDDMGGEVPTPGEEGMGGDIEPYSSQVLRRLHQDASILLPEYDEMLYHLEHEGVKTHLTQKLQSLVDELEQIESTHGEHHPGLPRIEGSVDLNSLSNMNSGLGGEGEEELGEEGEEGTEVGSPEGMESETPELEGEEDKPPPKKKKSESSKTTTEGDSEEPEEPDVDEAVEGMKKSEKSLRTKYKKMLSKGIKTKAVPSTGEGQLDEVALPANKKPALPTEPHVLASPFDPHEHEYIGNAHKYLGSVNQEKMHNWTENDRHESYSHHKFMDTVAEKYGLKYLSQSPSDEMGGEEKGFPKMNDLGEPDLPVMNSCHSADFPEMNHVDDKESNIHKGTKNHPEAAMEKVDEMVDLTVPQGYDPKLTHKALKDSSNFLKELSSTYDLTDDHLHRAAGHAKGLEPFATMIDMAGTNVGGENDIVPAANKPDTQIVGATGEKSLEDTYKQQYESTVELNNKIVALYNRFCK